MDRPPCKHNRTVILRSVGAIFTHCSECGVFYVKEGVASRLATTIEARLLIALTSYTARTHTVPIYDINSPTYQKITS